MMDKEIIENRINNFWGYGNLNSDIWFIGMEEGFSGNIEDLSNRLHKTLNKKVIDIKDDMLDVEDHIKWFLPNASMQRTLSKLILILLKINGSINTSNSDIKYYQVNNFGRLNSNHASLEFMPLPCKSINKKDWIYKDFNIDYLSSREEYLNEILPKRIQLFQKIIKKNKPKIIIFYSLIYLDKWEEIIDSKLEKRGKFYFTQKNDSYIFVIPHPVAYGMSKQDWDNIAEEIKNMST